VPRSIERYRTIIEVNRVAIVETAPEKVFCGMCAALKKVMPCDRAGLTVYDPEHDALKIAALYGRYENSFFRVGDFLRRNDSQNGWTFEHQSRTLRRDLAKEHQFALEKHTLEEGFRSLCSVPLVVYGKGVGVVTILCQQKNQYSHRDGEYLQDVANHCFIGGNARTSLHPPSPIETRVPSMHCLGRGPHDDGQVQRATIGVGAKRRAS